MNLLQQWLCAFFLSSVSFDSLFAESCFAPSLFVGPHGHRATHTMTQSSLCGLAQGPLFGWGRKVGEGSPLNVTNVFVLSLHFCLSGHPWACLILHVQSITTAQFVLRRTSCKKKCLSSCEKLVWIYNLLWVFLNNLSRQTWWTPGCFKYLCTNRVCMIVMLDV